MMEDSPMQTTFPGFRHLRSALVIGACVAGLGTAHAQCVGDCNADDEVTVNEIITGVNIALGTAAVGSCQVFDADGSGDVTVNEIVAAVNNLLAQCPPSVPTETPLPTLAPTGTAPVGSTGTATASPGATASAMPSSTPTPTAKPMGTSSPKPTDTPRAPSVTATATATASATATAGTAVCGNGIIEAGESCDDGNTLTNPPTDTCPADCTVIRCSLSGTKRLVTVTFAPPAGKSVASISVLLEYPDGIVQIAGSGSADSVQAVILNTPNGTLPISFDYDYALNVAIAGTTAITSGKLLDVNFSDCRNVAAPTTSAFTCTVLTATAPDLSPVAGATCAATAP
jgi:cysteine-rich repeat protein